MEIPHFDLGGNGHPIHFLHANGYPPACYQQLFELLKNEYHVFGMMLRPLWDETRPEEIDDWQSFSEDLRVFLSTYSYGSSSQGAPEPVIGIGHSIGAIVTLRAALKYPRKFRGTGPVRSGSLCAASSRGMEGTAGTGSPGSSSDPDHPESKTHLQGSGLRL